MNIKKTIAFLAIAMAVAFVASVGMASAALPVTKTLWAGQDIDVGTVTVSDDGGFIKIEYALTAAAVAADWELTACHVYVDTTQPTKSAPGRFPFKCDVVAPVTSTSVLTDVPASGTLFIAAQAELQRDTGGVDADGNIIYQFESGWAEGEPIRPGKNWATYFVVNPVTKYASKELVKAGEEVVYTVVVSNHYDSPVKMMEVKETMQMMTYVEESCSLLAIAAVKENVMKNVGKESIMTWTAMDAGVRIPVLEIAPGASTRITLKATIDQDAVKGQILRNYVDVTLRRAGVTEVIRAEAVVEVIA